MNWIEVLSAAVCGGIGGGLGALLAKPFQGRASTAAGRERLARLSPPKGGSSFQYIAMVPTMIGIALGMKVVRPWATEAWADASARTPAEKFARATHKNLASTPELQAWARTLQSRGLSPEQAGIEGRKLGANGIARLSDAELLARARILARGTKLVDPHTCANFARGGAGGADLDKLLDAVGENDAQELATIAAHSMLAELRQSPAARPATTEDDVTKIFETVARISGDSALTSVKQVFVSGATDVEVCSGAGILYDVLPRADAPMQHRLAMMLAGL